MTRDTSGRSSAAGSAHGPLPSKNEDGNGDEVLVSEVPQLDDAPPGRLSKASSPGESHAPTGVAAQDSATAESQPMSASNSHASNLSIKDSAGSGSAAPYGTRSRNRTGASRPNYAEDKELDAEFEITATTKEPSGRKARATDAGASEGGKSTNSTRKGAAPEGEQNSTVQNHYKDPIPGTSTFSANPAAGSGTTQTSKKRKAASQSTSSQAQQASSHTNLPAQTVTRRASMAVQVATGFRETNMLTFENCAGRLKGKKLVADDGTILQVNG